MVIAQSVLFMDESRSLGDWRIDLGIKAQDVVFQLDSQVPLGRGCTYEDVCNVVAFLASDESSYMTGQAINVTGGQEMR